MYQNWFHSGTRREGRDHARLACDPGHHILNWLTRSVLRVAYTV
jgi:hypothetical protein